MQILLIISITLLVFLSAFLSNDTILYDKNGRGINKITGMGWCIFIINLGIILLSLTQYKVSEDESNKRDSAMRTTYTESVERIIRSQDSNTIKLKNSSDTNTIVIKDDNETNTRNILTALKNAGLKYNPNNKTIDVASPLLMLNPHDEIKLEDSITGKYSVSLISLEASSTNFNVRCYYVMQFKNDILKYCGNDNALSKNLILPANLPLTYDFYYKIRCDNIFLQLKGTYSNIANSKTFKIDYLYRYNCLTKNTSIVSDEAAPKVKDFITTNEFLKSKK